MNSLVPIPQIDVSVRDATLGDVPFIDELQKRHHKQLGFMRTSWIEAKIRAGQIVVAEENLTTDYTDNTDRSSDLNLSVPSVKSVVQRIGYCISTDRYQKHDDIGIVYQMNVVPGRQRAFVGATLLKAVFDRAAYGCKLFCCWCAQDLAANRFWESMGFVPLAYRAGSEKKRRVHIFWQKRIREGDDQTNWWFPAATTAGAMNADRLVLPIPPGLHWSDEMPVIIRPGDGERSEVRGQISDKKPKAPAPKPVVQTSRRLSFAPVAPTPAAKVEKKVREKKPKAKNDPKLAAAARELRDRWLEQINSGVAQIESAGKYDVARAPPDRGQRHLSATAVNHTPLLPAAAA